MEVALNSSIKASNTEKIEQGVETSKVAQSYNPIKFISCISAVFLVAGLTITISATSTSEKSVRYDNLAGCKETDWETAQLCEIPVSFSEDFKGEMNIYFEIRNFQQNTFEYESSKSLGQLQGETLSKNRIASCEPIITLGDLGRVLGRDNDEIANPCGLIAKTVFNDTFTLIGSDSQPLEINRESIDWGISFEGNDQEFQWTDVEDEGFGVWVKTAGLPRVLKLWGRILNMQSGRYSLRFESRYDVTAFNGEKHIVFAKCNLLGGSHLVLGIFYLVSGGLLTGFSAFFAVRVKRLRMKVQTDQSV